MFDLFKRDYNEIKPSVRFVTLPFIEEKPKKKKPRRQRTQKNLKRLVYKANQRSKEARILIGVNEMKKLNDFYYDDFEEREKVFDA